MAFAIIQAAGKQFKVSEGEVLRLPRISAEVGASVEFELLLKGNGEIVEFGSTSPASPRVTVTVLEHGRGTKLIVFKKKRRKQYKRKKGHRQEFTAVRVESIGGPESRDD